MADQWRFGWWDEAKKTVQLGVNLEEIEREKFLVLEEAKANRKKDWEEVLKRKMKARPTMADMARDDSDDEPDDAAVENAKNGKGVGQNQLLPQLLPMGIVIENGPTNMDVHCSYRVALRMIQ